MKQNRILIVEDDNIAAKYLLAKLDQFGYEVCGVAETGQQAISLAAETKPDLILMDINLGGRIDGIQAAERIKSSQNIALVFITAYADDDIIQRAKLTGPHGYLTKPIESKALHTTLEIVLNKFELENKLIESELRYRTLVLTATDGVLTLDEQGMVTSCNYRILEMIGHSEEELIGKSIKKILPDVFINHLAVGRRKFLEVGKQITADTMELYAKGKDGTNFPVELSFSQWEMNDRMYYTLIIRDIHERKETEAALKAAQEQLENRVAQRSAELGALIEHSPLAVGVFDTDGRITSSNKAWESTFSLMNNSLPLSEYNIFKDELLSRYGYLDDLAQLFASGGSLITGPIYFDPAEDSADEAEGVLLVFRFKAVTNTQGKVYCVLNIVEDMTERQKAEDSSIELKQQKDYAVLIIENLETERSRIARELHDSVGQLLTAIKLRLETFERTGSNDLSIIHKSKELVTLAGKEIKNIIYSLHPAFLDAFGLSPAITALIQEAEISSNININLEFDDPLVRFNPKIELHVFRIVQESLNNLIRHAKATNANISVNVKDNYLYIYIRDDGSGFKMTPGAGTEKKHSFGLINIRERVKLLGGNFQIESIENKGTELFVEIPIGNLS